MPLGVGDGDTIVDAVFSLHQSQVGLDLCSVHASHRGGPRHDGEIGLSLTDPSLQKLLLLGRNVLQLARNDIR